MWVVLLGELLQLVLDGHGAAGWLGALPCLLQALLLLNTEATLQVRMQPCMCTYTCIYIYTCICIYVCICRYICTHTHIYIYVGVPQRGVVAARAPSALLHTPCNGHLLHTLCCGFSLL